MKLSFAVILEEDKLLSLESKCRLLHRFSYPAVELAVRNPAKIDRDQLAGTLRKNKLELSAISTGRIFLEERLSLSSPDKATRDKAVKRITSHIDLAGKLNSRVIVGLARGKLSSLHKQDYLWKRSYNNLFQSMQKVCDYAQRKGVEIVLEPINRYETSFLHTSEETIGFIRKLGYKKLQLMLDTFHMNIEEKNICASFARSKNYLSYLHLADSNRLCPGKGHLDFSAIIGSLRKIGYRGYLSAEISPSPNFSSSFVEYARNMLRYL